MRLQRQRATQRIQTVRRVAAHEVNPPDRGLGNQVPLNGVTKAFVDAHAIHVHGKALRFAEKRRKCEAPIRQVLLVGAVLHVRYADATERLFHEVSQVARLQRIDVLVRDRLDCSGNAIACHPGAGHRGNADDFNLGQSLLRDDGNCAGCGCNEHNRAQRRHAEAARRTQQQIHGRNNPGTRYTEPVKVQGVFVRRNRQAAKGVSLRHKALTPTGKRSVVTGNRRSAGSSPD